MANFANVTYDAARAAIAAEEGVAAVVAVLEVLVVVVVAALVVSSNSSISSSSSRSSSRSRSFWLPHGLSRKTAWQVTGGLRLTRSSGSSSRYKHK